MASDDSYLASIDYHIRKSYTDRKKTRVTESMRANTLFVLAWLVGRKLEEQAIAQTSSDAQPKDDDESTKIKEDD